MQLVLALTTEVVGPMATEGVVAMVVDSVEEDSEDIKLSGRCP